MSSLAASLAELYCPRFSERQSLYFSVSLTHICTKEEEEVRGRRTRRGNIIRERTMRESTKGMRRGRRKWSGGGEGEALCFQPGCIFRILGFSMWVLEWKGSSVYPFAGLFVLRSMGGQICPFHRTAWHHVRNTCFFNAKFKSLEVTCPQAKASHLSSPMTGHFLDA